MTLNTNLWNKIRYTVYTPIYDLVAGNFGQSRKKSIDALGDLSHKSILIVGAGTGLDLEFLPSDCEITATDITPAMVKQIKKRNEKLKLNVQTAVMDGQALEFPDKSFDRVILHLILAVIPDPKRCIKESERVLKQGGQIAVFDKFIRKDTKVSFLRKILNIFTNLMFSDITRDIHALVHETELTLLEERDADFYGNFRILKYQKN